MNNKHKLWVEKYRPQTFDDYIFHNESHERAFRRFVADKSIPHLLLTGVQGSGKTTIVYILVKEIGIDPSDFLVINASDEARIDDIRERIKEFVSTWAMGDFKVVFLDEADYIHHTGQAALRRLTEEYSDTTRFILTANDESRIIPALKSRMQHFRFKTPDVNDITARMAEILVSEKVKFNLELLDMYTAVAFPDVRKIINLLQQNTHDNKLHPPVDVAEVGDYKFKLLDMLNIDNWSEMRKLACGNVLPEEWPSIYRFLYENLHKSKKFSKQNKWEEGIVIISEHLYQHSSVADPEINAAAMFIRLSLI